MSVDQESRYRQLPSGLFSWIEQALLILIPICGIIFILDLPLALFGFSLQSQQYLGLFLGLVMALLFISMPSTKGAARERVPWYDALLAGLSVITGVYVLILYPSLQITISMVTPFEMLIGATTLVLVLEATRRATGLFLVVIILGFVVYMRFGYLLPGAFGAPEFGWPDVINGLFLGTSAMYGVALRVGAVVVFSFILFAQALFATGGAKFLFELAESLMGRYRGGPAKVSIVASSLLGMLSGSAVANVAGTGVITIPLMKRTGYSAEYACAIEAVSSTGGQIAPPVMGATAFVIASFLGMDYGEIALAAIVPASLYYLSVFMQVDLRARKDNLKGLAREELPSFTKTVRGGWLYLVPFTVLVYALLVMRLRPETSSLYALTALLGLLLLTGAKLDVRMVIEILMKTSRAIMEVIAITAAVGLVIGVASYTGLGFSFSNIIKELAGGSLFLLLILCAAASIILGMGVPALVSYIFLAVLVAPALVEVGVLPLSAHLFIFYFGILSFVTPPVCLATYTACAIGKGDLMRTALQAVQLAAAGFVVPFIFVYNPSLLLVGSRAMIFVAILTTLVAVFAISLTMEGYFLVHLSWLKRALFMISAIGLILSGLWWLQVLAAFLFAGLIAWEIFASMRPQRVSL